jgi:TetR/AcrR family transcriptional regulator, tetracycline repressor protein
MALDADTVVRVALELLRADGLPGVTFRKLTTRLGVAAPAIYWRFANKQELLEAMAEQMLREQFGELRPLANGRSWRKWLFKTLHTLRRAMLAYPDGARVVTGSRPLHTPTLGLIPEYALAGTNLDPTEAMTVVYTALHFTFGHVIEEQESTLAHRMDSDTAARFGASFPTVMRTMTAAQHAGASPDTVYDACLSRIIDR